MKEIALYLIVTLSALFIMGYSVHMLIGGLVSPVTEKLVITVVCLVGAGIIGLMTWDILKRRNGKV